MNVKRNWSYVSYNRQQTEKVYGKNWKVMEKFPSSVPIPFSVPLNCQNVEILKDLYNFKTFVPLNSMSGFMHWIQSLTKALYGMTDQKYILFVSCMINHAELFSWCWNSSFTSPPCKLIQINCWNVVGV